MRLMTGTLASAPGIFRISLKSSSVMQAEEHVFYGAGKITGNRTDSYMFHIIKPSDHSEAEFCVTTKPHQ